MKLRLKFNKCGNLKFISHLDLIRLFQRSFAMANVPIDYSEGFNPHPRFSIGNPLPLGINSECEYMDLQLREEVIPEEIVDSLNRVLPKNIKILGYSLENLDKNVSRIIEYALYEFTIYDYDKKFDDIDEFNTKISIWLENDEIKITRFRKKKGKKTEIEENIKEYLESVQVVSYEDELKIDAIIRNGAEKYLKPELFFEALNRDLELGIDLNSVYINRVNLFDENMEEII
ncbi:MAG: DUF2344 domain-containing protein [Tissierellia bacterium]|nr:DUF2344 domain-containing protein [Tissierellia bacterium]